MTDYNSLSEEDQLKLIKKDYWLIKYINNPTEAVQLASIKILGYIIEVIKNPTEVTQIEAVKNLDYYDDIEDIFVNKYIKSDKAKELYYKLKKMKVIIT